MARSVRRGIAVATFVVLAGPAPAAPPDRTAVLDGRYRLDASVPFTAALFHFVDNLAGTSAGKTVPLHQAEFHSRFGDYTAEEVELLRRFAEVRLRDADGPRGGDSMLGAFLEARDVPSALAAIRGRLTPRDVETLSEVLEHFRPRYEVIWDGGRIPRRFLERLTRGPLPGRLSAFLARVARFYGVDPMAQPPPRLVLVPVPDGDGTHAQAVGRTLLIEIRPSDRPEEEVAPIVHENAHFLFLAIDPERRRRLAQGMEAEGPLGSEAWRALGEALPTAIAQGVADKTFRPGEWSSSVPWYHLEEVDAYAKAIFPLVERALGDGTRLDGKFLRRALESYPGFSQAARWRGVTPR